jgi:hypothetical protein
MKTILFISLFTIISALSGSLTESKTNSQLPGESEIPIPVIMTPLNYTSCDSTCNFSWTSSGKNITYELLISESSSFVTNKSYTTIDTTLLCPLGAKTNNYKYCKVRAWKNSKTYSDWSPLVTFYHGSSSLIYNPDLIKISGGCQGNCGNCKHPCGRRPNK